MKDVLLLIPASAAHHPSAIAARVETKRRQEAVDEAWFEGLVAGGVLGVLAGLGIAGVLVGWVMR
jgi:hypothetical protein